MSEWEYHKVALNQLARKTDDINLLCEAGLDGWELIAILANNIAYLKRRAGDPVSGTIEHPEGAVPRGQDADASRNGSTAGRGYEVKAKSTAIPRPTKRGRAEAGWQAGLKSKQDAGEDIDDYLA